MSLSVEQLAEIMARDAEVPRSQAMSENRRVRRIEKRGTLTIVAYDNGKVGPAQTVTVRNLSARGIAITHTQEMRPGQQFVAHVPRATGEPLSILCTVVHCREGRSGQYSIGAELTCAIDRQDQTGHSISPAEMERIRRSILGEN